MLEIVYKKVSDLIPYVNNARTHSEAQINKIVASIKEFQFTNPVLIDGDNGVIAGHGRLMAAQKLGMEEMPTVELSHLSPAQKKAYIIADNKLALEATWDDELLAFEFKDLEEMDFDLELTGFSLDEIEAFDFDGDNETEGLTDPDEVPDVPEEPVSKLGDVWLLGRHRVMVGDCRIFDSVNKLLAGNKINVAITSPPYASQRKYDESSGFKPIPANEYVAWYRDVSSNIKANIAEDGSYFCNIKEHCEEGQRSLYVKDLTISHVREWGWMFVDEFCWNKPGPPGKWPNRFKNSFEPIFHFSKWNKIKFNPDNVFIDTESAIGVGETITDKSNGQYWHLPKARISGQAWPDNVLKIGSAGQEANGHQAAFPVALPEFFIKAFSDEKDCIYDPFLGSGSTLIAAEKTNRICFGLEISPAYVDVICQRFLDFTGVQPILESTGQTFNEVKEALNG